MAEEFIKGQFFRVCKAYADATSRITLRYPRTYRAENEFPALGLIPYAHDSICQYVSLFLGRMSRDGMHIPMYRPVLKPLSVAFTFSFSTISAYLLLSRFPDTASKASSVSTITISARQIVANQPLLPKRSRCCECLSPGKGTQSIYSIRMRWGADKQASPTSHVRSSQYRQALRPRVPRVPHRTPLNQSCCWVTWGHTWL